MIKQRRSKWRIQWIIPCSYELISRKKNKDQFGWGIIRNIADKGAEFATRFNISVGESMRLNFYVKDKQLVSKLEGRIVRLKKEGIYRVVGLVFEGKEVQDQAKSAIADILNSNW